MKKTLAMALLLMFCVSPVTATSRVNPTSRLIALLVGQGWGWPFQSEFEYELVFAHFGNGDGLSSEVVLYGPDQEVEVQARVVVTDDAGQPMTVELTDGSLSGQSDITIPASGLYRIQTTGFGPLTQGSVRVLSDQPLKGVILFGGQYGLAGVAPSAPMRHGFATPVDEDSGLQIYTGIAVVNLEDNDIELELSLYDSSGNLRDTARLEMPARGHLARLLNQFEWSGTMDLARVEGILEVYSAGKIAATALQIRPGQYASLPVAALSDGRPPSEESICEGTWAGTYDDGQDSRVTFRVVDQTTIESVRVSFIGCNGQPAQATAEMGTIRPDRSFSISLTGPDIIGSFKGTFSQDGKSIDLRKVDVSSAGVFLLKRCGGGNFSWRAQPNEPCN